MTNFFKVSTGSHYSTLRQLVTFFFLTVILYSFHVHFLIYALLNQQTSILYTKYEKHNNLRISCELTTSYIFYIQVKHY